MHTSNSTHKNRRSPSKSTHPNQPKHRASNSEQRKTRRRARRGIKQELRRYLGPVQS